LPTTNSPSWSQEKKLFTPMLLKAYNRKYKKERFGGDYYVARVASGVLE
jgi:hypothetical protein